MKVISGFVKHTLKKTLSIITFYNKYLSKLKIILIKKRIILVHDQRNEANSGDFILFYLTMPISKGKKFCLIKILNLVVNLDND